VILGGAVLQYFDSSFYNFCLQEQKVIGVTDPRYDLVARHVFARNDQDAALEPYLAECWLLIIYDGSMFHILVSVNCVIDVGISPMHVDYYIALVLPFNIMLDLAIYVKAFCDVFVTIFCILSLLRVFHCEYLNAFSM